MFEKLKKILKRNCKHQGRNITVGIVVAFLLSCSVVMADDIPTPTNYGTQIEFKDNDITITIDGEPADKPTEDEWESPTYTQNGSISKSVKFDGANITVDGINKGTSTAENIGEVYGLKLTNTLDVEINFIQNGTIASSYTETEIKYSTGDEGTIINTPRTNKGNGLVIAEGDIKVEVDGNIKGEVELHGAKNAQVSADDSANGIYGSTNIGNITGNISGKATLTGGNDNSANDDIYAFVDADNSANGIYTNASQKSISIGDITGNVSGEVLLMGRNSTDDNTYASVHASSSANGIYTYTVTGTAGSQNSISIGKIIGNISGKAILLGENSAVLQDVTHLFFARCSANGIYTYIHFYDDKYITSKDSIEIGDITGNISGKAILLGGNKATTNPIANIFVQDSFANGICTEIYTESSQKSISIGNIVGNINGMATLIGGNNTEVNKAGTFADASARANDSSANGVYISVTDIFENSINSISIDNITGNINGNAILLGGDNTSTKVDSVFANISTYTSANGIYTQTLGRSGSESFKGSIDIGNIAGNISGKALLLGGNNTSTQADAYAEAKTSANGIYALSENSSESSSIDIGNITGNIGGKTLLLGGNDTSAKTWADVYAQAKTSANGIYTETDIDSSKNSIVIGDIAGNVSGKAILSGGDNTSAETEVQAYVSATASANGIYTKSSQSSIGNITGSVSGFAILQRGGIKNSPNTSNTSITAIASANGIYFDSSADINNSGKVQGYAGFLDNDGKLIDQLKVDEENLKFSGNGVAIASAYNNNFVNKGVIAGSESAVALGSIGDGGSINNYGIMAGKKILGDGQKNLGNATDNGKFNNCGLQLILETEKKDNNYSLVVKEIVADYQEGINKNNSGYTIWNASIKKNNENKEATDKEITTESIKLYDKTKYTNYIFNGIDNTVSSSDGKASSIKNSVINAFKTAVSMEGGTLYVTDTVINGGSDISYTYDKTKFTKDTYDPTSPSTDNDPENILKVEVSPALKFTKDESKFYALGESVINGDIKVESSNNEITLGLYSQLNGDIIGNGADNTLHLGTVTENESVQEGATLNIQDNITNINHIDIDNSVTFYENISVTGDEITIAENGTLNLRLGATEEIKDEVKVENEGGTSQTYSNVPVAEHALDEFNGTIKGYGDSTDATLNFITQGIGQQIYVPFKDDIKVDNIKFEFSSIIDTGAVGKDFILITASSDLNEIINPDIGDHTDPDTGNSDPDFEEFDPNNPPVDPPVKPDVPYANRYAQLNDIYKSIYSSGGDNLNALRTILSLTDKPSDGNYDSETNEAEQLKNLMNYLNGVYSHSPYAFSSELSRKSVGMFRDIVTDNSFIPNYKKWLVMGGLTHQDAGTTDTYYGKNYHGFDTGTADVDADSKLTGAYVLAKYGYSDKVTLGITAGGNKGDTELSTDSKVKDNAGYIGGFVENYRGNLTLKAGTGVQYSEFDATRKTINDSYSDKYSDMAYDIYGSLKYSLPLDNNFFLEPYGVLSYTHINQEGVDEGNKVLAIETDDKEFNYTTLKTGVDLKKVIPTEKAKHTLTAGVSYERFLDGDDEEYITGRMKGGTDFDILVAHKNKHQISLNAKYEIEREDGILLNLKGEYSFQRDEHNNGAKNKTEGEWTVGATIGYKF